jgi:ATP-dependent exoDNAse (exonuclease V) beta subunit
VQRFLEVLHRAEESGHASLSGFLDHWRRRSTEIKVPMPENAPAVQVTTIHKAKGLQFPVVVVPFTDFRISATNDLEVVRAAGEDVLLPLAPYVGEEYHRRLGRNALEALNLLYVACTRPREELYAFIPGAGTSPGPFARAVRLLLEEAGLDPGQEAVRCGCLPATTSADQTRPGPAPRDAKPTPVTTTHGQGSHWLGRLRVYRNLTQDTDLGLDEAMRGTLMHAALEAFHPCGDIETAARLAVSEALARHPFLDPEHSELARDMTSMLRWLAHEPELASLLARGQREVDVVDADGARHRMDLLVEDRTGMLVVDYKTGGYVPGAHEEQVKGYMRLAGAATGKPARGLLVYLDARRLHWVKD